jgi:hypothetical protein
MEGERIAVKAMMGVSLRAYARMRGCSLPAVQKAIKSKRISLLPDGSIDPERANQEWERNTLSGTAPTRTQAASRGGSAKATVPPAPPAVPQPASAMSDPVGQYLRSRAVNETFKAKISQLEYEERSRKLIPATRASEYAAMFSAIVKDALLSMPDRLAPMLAAVDNEKTTHRMLLAEVTAVLKKVNKAVSDSGL